MKIAYISKTPMTDVDFSYLHSAQKLIDITYYLEITPRYLRGAAINLKECFLKSGVFLSEIYPELNRYKTCINTNKVRIVNTSGKWWVLKAIWTNFKLLRELRKQKYDVIHISWPLNFYELMLYRLGSKMVLTVHDPLPHSGMISIPTVLRRKFAFYFLNNFIILNKKQKDSFIRIYKLQKKNIYESKLSCYSYLQTIAKPDSDFKGKYILYFGQISSYKGLEYLFPAFEKLHKIHPNVTLVVAGSGEYYFDISEYRDKSYFKILHRFIPDDELAALIRGSEFSVIPYKDATQSGVAMSAFAFNKPVVATNVGGIPEMLGNGEYGLLVPPCDVNALADAMCQMLEAPMLIQNFSDNIKRDYSDGSYSWKEICKEYIWIYERIANGKG